MVANRSSTVAPVFRRFLAVSTLSLRTRFVLIGKIGGLDLLELVVLSAGGLLGDLRDFVTSCLYFCTSESALANIVGIRTGDTPRFRVTEFVKRSGDALFSASSLSKFRTDFFYTRRHYRSLLEV